MNYSTGDFARIAPQKKPCRPDAGGTACGRRSGLELVVDAQIVILARLHGGHRTAEGLLRLVLRPVEVVTLEAEARALEPAGLELVARLRRHPGLRLDVDERRVRADDAVVGHAADVLRALVVGDEGAEPPFLEVEDHLLVDVRQVRKARRQIGLYLVCRPEPD